MKTLVSLVSEQTIPNLEIIEEFKNETNKYLFFHSEKTVEHVNWLISAAQIDETACFRQVIDPFNLTEIQNILQSYQFGDESFILNITGGTKPWIIAFLEKFKDLGAEIFYVTGKPREYMKVFPRKGKAILRLNANIGIQKYLLANGFSIKEGMPYADFDSAQRFFELFMSQPIENFFEFINFFRPLRKSKKIIPFTDLNPEYQQILEQVSYGKEDGNLNKYDFRYFAGDWLEEWVYFKLKQELNLNDTEILTGTEITKSSTPNEMDVMFLLDHQLYVIECKTAVFEEREQSDQSMKLTNILGETIYKSDALRSKLGLFAKSTILTLSELLEDDMKPLQKFQVHFDRAQLSNINIVSRKKLQNNLSFTQILDIKHAHQPL